MTDSPVTVTFPADVARSAIVALEESADRLVTVARRASRQVEADAAGGRDKRTGAVKVHAMLVEADRMIDGATAIRRTLDGPTSPPAAAESSPRPPATHPTAGQAVTAALNDARVVAAAAVLTDADDLNLATLSEPELEVIARAADLGALDGSRVLDDDETPADLKAAALAELARRRAIGTGIADDGTVGPVPGQDPRTGVAPEDGRVAGTDADLTVDDVTALLDDELTAEPPPGTVDTDAEVGAS